MVGVVEGIFRHGIGFELANEFLVAHNSAPSLLVAPGSRAHAGLYLLLATANAAAV
jgi:hypothetical protein